MRTDGVLSASTLVLGVAAAHANHRSILVAGVAGLVAGSMSMAAGEYVSVPLTGRKSVRSILYVRPAMKFQQFSLGRFGSMALNTAMTW